MPDYYNSKQWQNCLLHLGDWRGSFTEISPQTQILKDTPTLVTLHGADQNRRILQTVQRFPIDGSPPTQLNLEYTTLSRGLMFFDNGAFSLGSMQYAPFTKFGAEFGFIAGDRRLRFVEMFDENGQFSSLTLIREHRDGVPMVERPALTIEQLLGTWEGEVITLFPDWREPTRQTSRLQIDRIGDRIHQDLQTDGLHIRSEARLQGQTLRFAGASGVETIVNLLPDGGSCHVPISIPRGKPFCLEAGWLVEPDLRLRLIRFYDQLGGWTTLTCAIEQRLQTA